MAYVSPRWFRKVSNPVSLDSRESLTASFRSGLRG